MLPKRLRSSCLSLMLLLAAFFSISIHAESIKSLPRPVNYVSDYAGVLSPTVVDQLNHLCSRLDHAANAQIAVVTIHSLDGMEASDYANQLEELWKVGPKGSNRGILMLFAIKDHKRWIEVGYGLEGILPDGKVGEIGRNMVPALKAGNYDAAVQLGVGQIAQVIAEDAKVSLGDQPDAAPVQQRRAGLHLPLWVLLLIVFPGFFIIFFILQVLMRAGLFIGGGPWMGGGGFGGGDDGGGGFGGFGGGDSGGGGAGGDW